MSRRLPAALGFVCLLVIQSLTLKGQESRPKQTEFKNGVVVSVSAPASDVGLAILREGGNAVDAAVATAFALAVTHPAAGNIGGGGFMLVHPAKGEPAVIDYRETAPVAAAKEMFKKGDSHFSHRVVGVPGTVRGLALAHTRFGKLPWKNLVLPAAKLAEEGFVIDRHHAESLNKVVDAASDVVEFMRVFSRADGTSWIEGDRLAQADLARTLRDIAEKGPDTFYRGTVAELIVAEMKRGGGLIDKEDLAGYEAIERKPIHGVYRSYDVYAPPPPSSGGVCLVEILNILESFDLTKQPRQSSETLHLMAEAMRRAFCDRARHLGDPAFTKIPAHLLTREYAIDKDGMAVANTYTLEHGYGSRIVVRGAGFLLNNEMMDFNWRPGITDKRGGIGTPPNLIAPGKRMLSSQCPTMLAKDGKVVLVTGSPGSRTIINTVLGIVVSVVDYGMPIEEAVDAPRLHQSWFPDEVRLERSAAFRKTAAALTVLGHRVVAEEKQGDAHSIWVDPRSGAYIAAADRRLSGKAAGY